MNYYYSFSIIVVSVAVLFMFLNKNACPDVSPCYCAIKFHEIYVNCSNVSTMKGIKLTFSRITPPIEITKMAIHFNSHNSKVFIPADLLGESFIKGELFLQGSNVTSSAKTLLTIDPNAFRSSKATLKIFNIDTVDTARLDFQFLTGFQKFATLDFDGCLNLGKVLPTLPALPTLSSIRFVRCYAIKLPSNNMPALQTNGLASFSIESCKVQDASVVQLMDWILPSSSQSLKELIITYHRMRSSPVQFGSFRNLEYFELYYSHSKDMILKSNSFYAPGPPTITIFDFRQSFVIDIEPETFQGNYSSTALMDLSNNYLTRFEESAFKSVLQDMQAGRSFLIASGTLNIHSNRFNCFSDPCHLSWLLRDNRDLLNFIEGATCKNGVNFADLSPDLFTDCP